MSSVIEYAQLRVRAPLERASCPNRLVEKCVQLQTMLAPVPTGTGSVNRLPAGVILTFSSLSAGGITSPPGEMHGQKSGSATPMLVYTKRLGAVSAGLLAAPTPFG